MGRLSLFISSFLVFGIFTLFSYTVAKEAWQTIDFSTTVKLQDHLPRRLDGPFSLLSLLASAEVTFLIAGILSVFCAIRLKFWAALGWVLIIPAVLVEVVGKLLIYHPAPPNFFLRTVDLEKNIPHFYVHTDFSYPSGHMTRTIFMVTVLLILTIIKVRNVVIKQICILGLIFLGLVMMVSRVYLGEHWLSDVFGGSLLGLSSGLFAAGLIIGRKIHLRDLFR